MKHDAAGSPPGESRRLVLTLGLNGERVTISFTATTAEDGGRLDLVVAGRITDISRSHAGRLIRDGKVTVNGSGKKAGYVLRQGDHVCIEIPPPKALQVEPEPIPLSVIFEDSDILVIDKPPGLVVHPGAGHQAGTLVNALLHHCHDLGGIGGVLRPGIVHRLDKDTSGCLIIAKNDQAHESLSWQFKARNTQKRYLALVYGEMLKSEGVVDLPIGRHPSDRKKMSTESRHSRHAETRWQVKETFSGATLLEVDIKTGRTHQIRVHCAAIGHPVIGDPTYGGAKRWKTMPSAELQNLTRSIKRQMLHAWKLTITHPRTDVSMEFESPLPEDMESLLNKLRMVL